MTALTAVVSVITQWKDNPKVALGLVIVALLVTVSILVRPVVAFLRKRMAQARRNRLARSHYPELSWFIKRFAKFLNHDDWGNLRNILFTFCGNNDEELTKLYPPDYLKEIFPLFLGRIEHTTARNEQDLSKAATEFYWLVALYDRYQVLLPFQRMRQFPSVVQEAKDQSGKSVLTIESKPWLASLAPQHRPEAERRIEDFRERWASYLGDLNSFLEKLSELLPGGGIPSYFERPQKL